MTAESDPGNVVAHEHVAPAGMVSGRRRILRGGFGVAPVLMTLVSGPVLAATCVTASRHVSMHASTVEKIAQSCSGRSPQNWLDNINIAGVWPRNPDDKFLDLFANNFNFNGNPKLRDVLAWYPLTGGQGLAADCVAALLNASTSPLLTPAVVLGPTLITTIWGGRGVYVPTAGVPAWTLGETRAWIQMTFTR